MCDEKAAAAEKFSWGRKLNGRCRRRRVVCVITGRGRREKRKCVCCVRADKCVELGRSHSENLAFTAQGDGKTDSRGGANPHFAAPHMHENGNSGLMFAVADVGWDKC